MPANLPPEYYEAEKNFKEAPPRPGEGGRAGGPDCHGAQAQGHRQAQGGPQAKALEAAGRGGQEKKGRPRRPLLCSERGSGADCPGGLCQLRQVLGACLAYKRQAHDRRIPGYHGYAPAGDDALRGHTVSDGGPPANRQRVLRRLGLGHTEGGGHTAAGNRPC